MLKLSNIHYFHYMPSAKLTIQRSSEHINRLRNCSIQLNGKEIGKIANGEIKTFEWEPGTYRLQATIDWCGSPEIDIQLKEGEEKILRLSSFKQSSWLMPLSLVLLTAHFILVLFWENYMLIWAIFPVFLLFVYQMSVGRKKYLRWDEVALQ